METKKGNTLIEIIIVIAVLSIVIKFAMLDNSNPKGEAPLQVTQDKVRLQEGNIKRQKAISNLQNATMMNAVDSEPFEATVEGAKNYFKKNLNVVKETKDGFVDVDGIHYRFICKNENCTIKIKTSEKEPETNFPITVQNTKIEITE